MKRLLIVVMCWMAADPAFAGTFSIIQTAPPSSSVHLCDNEWGGLPNYLGCSRVISTTTLGTQLTLNIANNNDNSSVTPRQGAVSYTCNVTSASCTQNACTSANAIDTFTVHHGSPDPFTCNASGTVATGGTTSTDVETVSSGNGGANCVTAYRQDNSLNETMDFLFTESSDTAGAHLVACNQQAVNSLTSAPNIVTATVDGGNDLIIQGLAAGHVTSISGSWTPFFSVHFGFAYLANINVGTPPLWGESGVPSSWSAAGSSATWGEGQAQGIGIGQNIGLGNGLAWQ